MTSATSFWPLWRIASTRWNRCSTARGIAPRTAPGSPNIVYVLPEPVCPYANAHAL